MLKMNKKSHISPDASVLTSSWQCAPPTLCACCKFYLISLQSGYMLYIYTQVTSAGGNNCLEHALIFFLTLLKITVTVSEKKTNKFLAVVAENQHMKKLKGKRYGYT